MNGFFLLVPFFLIRFGLLALLERSALRRAAHFAPLRGGEKAAYWVYQLSNIAILGYLCFLSVSVSLAGAAVYLAGLAACTGSVVSFAASPEGGLRTEGAYRFSRHPMYAAYFIFFLGCAMLTRSLALLGIVLIFQISAHWIILAEERWCREQFGEAYQRYMERVRRYI